MLRDLIKFNGAAERLATDSTITLGEFMDELRMGQWFRDYYLTPISGAIWSTPKEEIMDFPAQALVRFFRNHQPDAGQRAAPVVHGAGRVHRICHAA
jgi:predicted NAD/FAD-binding protein